MNLLDRDTWQEIAHTLGSNRKRTITTAFGIFWGIFVLVILLSVGAGVENALKKELRGVSTNMGFISASPTTRPYKGFKEGRMWSMNMEDIARIRQSNPSIEHLSPINQLSSYYSGGEPLVYGTKKTNGNIIGITPEYNKVIKYNVEAGRLLTEADGKYRRSVCVIGKKIAIELIGNEQEALGKVIRVAGSFCTVVGVVSDISQNVNITGRASQSVFLPYEVVDAREPKAGQVYYFFFTVQANQTVAPVIRNIKSYLSNRYDLHPQDEGAIQSLDVSSIFQFFEMLLLSVYILIWVVGAGTLVSGVVGISNIMLVTVRERTREIGIRRALGGKPIDIIQQVLLESVSITLIAGLLGIMLGSWIMAAVDLATSSSEGELSTMLYHPVISFGTALMTLLVVIVGGLLGGGLPATRAIKIKAIEAIREE